MTPLVTTRIYNPETGLLLDGSSDMISFGAIAPGTNSGIIVVDAVLSGISAASEMGMGIADANLPEGSFPGTLYYSVLDSIESVAEPTTPFVGTSEYEGVSNVIDVGFRLPLVSKYVALMVRAPDRPLECGCMVLKWFFGFAKEV